jgi:hypothetical protein
MGRWEDGIRNDLAGIVISVCIWSRLPRLGCKQVPGPGYSCGGRFPVPRVCRRRTEPAVNEKPSYIDTCLSLKKDLAVFDNDPASRRGSISLMSVPVCMTGMGLPSIMQLEVHGQGGQLDVVDAGRACCALGQGCFEISSATCCRGASESCTWMVEGALLVLAWDGEIIAAEKQCFPIARILDLCHLFPSNLPLSRQDVTQPLTSRTYRHTQLSVPVPNPSVRPREHKSTEVQALMFVMPSFFCHQPNRFAYTK